MTVTIILGGILIVPPFLMHDASAYCPGNSIEATCGAISFPALVISGIYSLHLFGIPTPAIDERSTSAALPAVILFGLLHGLSPGHGWPIAILYSMRSPRPMLSGFISSGIIAAAHFISSIAVVVAYLFIATLVDIPKLYLHLGAAVALGILAYIFWKEKVENNDKRIVEDEHKDTHGTHEHAEHRHHHDHHQHSDHEHVEQRHTRWYQRLGRHHSHSHMHQHQEIMASSSLKAIAGFALVLGFAHEEEFVILALAAGGGDPIGLMLAYAGSVAAALIGVTLLSLKVYKRIQHKVMQYSKYLPKIAAILLLAMAVSFATGIGI